MSLFSKRTCSQIWKYLKNNATIVTMLIQIFSLVATTILTTLLVVANINSADISEHRKNSAQFMTTRELCYDFNNRYWMQDLIAREKHSPDLDFLHLWTYPL